MGEKASIFKARGLHGNRSCRCRGHKRGGQCALPGEISGFAIKLAPRKGGTMKPEKSAEAIVVGVIRRRAEPIENRELKSLELLGQKPRQRASVEGKGRKPEK
jgi:hypothetical protein